MSTSDNGSMFRPTLWEMIPSLATWGNLICGVAAVLSVTLHGNVALAAIFILTGWLLDLADGWLARKLLRGSPERLSLMATFGTSLDIASDTVTFGVAPAVCFYSNWVRYADIWQQTLLIPVAVVYVCSTAYRLARFMCIKRPGSLWFVGLFSDGAGLAASAIMAAANLAEGPGVKWFLAALLLLLSFLMTSTVRFPHNKTWVKPFPQVFLGLLLLGSAAWYFSGAWAIGYSVFWIAFLLTPAYHRVRGHYLVYP